RSDLIAAGPAKADGKPDFLASTLPLKGPFDNRTREWAEERRYGF
ncbi:hypothetical protein Tco_1518513, partial [Tanacetum coccineum]